MPLIARDAPAGWRPEPGDLVEGRKGKKTIEGEVVADPRKPRIAKVRALGRGGFIAYFLRTPDGREHAVNDVRP